MADGATGELGRIGLKRPDLFREHCYIDGEWVGEATHPVHNPATGGLIGRIPNLGKSETESAVAAAEAALPGWRAQTAQGRAEVLSKWKDLMVVFFDESHARSIGLPVDGLKIMVFTLLSAATVAALQTVLHGCEETCCIGAIYEPVIISD